MRQHSGRFGPEAAAGAGLIGDTRIAALISSGGSVDWLCFPRFDSEPVFGALIDTASGGRFAVSVDGARPEGRRYLPDEAVLETRWRSLRGEVVVADGMALDVSSELLPQALLIRRISSTAGAQRVRVVFDPRLGIPGRPPDRIRRTARGVLASWGALAVGISNDAGIAIEPGRETMLTVTPDRPLSICVGFTDRAPHIWIDPRRADDLLRDAGRWWTSWCREITYDGPYRDAVVRSLITLRLLTYSPSGAPVAAPTTALPAPPGTQRAWDYRFAWPRDAAIGAEAFGDFHGPETARAFMRWLLHATQTSRPRVDPLYTLFGRSTGRERVLRLPGRQEPVRIGNAAGRQRQLDVCGWVLNGAARLAEHELLDGDLWRAARQIAGYAARHWREPDHGIWEVRCEPQHHVPSKMMAWVALDRAIALAERYPAGRRRLERWKAERQALGEDIHTRGIDHERGTYVGRYGGKELDAALLLAPALGFGDPVVVTRTIAAVEQDLDAGYPLLFRYPPGYDGISDPDAAFLPCAFWLVRALALTGEHDRAARMLDRLIGLATPLGLYAEEMDPQTREHIGNFPQALSHASLLQAVKAVEDATAGREMRRESLRRPDARPAPRAVSRGRS